MKNQVYNQEEVVNENESEEKENFLNKNLFRVYALNNIDHSPNI